ncbi:MAG: DNA-binding transcriptional regulator, partial [Verrucomicrobiota bacterium]
MKRIAILVETALASGRQILTGVSRFLHERQDWSIYQYLGPMGTLEPEALRSWEGDGIIARISNREVLDMIIDKNIPTIDVLGNVSPQVFPLVKCDDTSVGAIVAKHFLENIHRNFAFIGLADERWSIERELAFRKEVHAVNQQVQTFHIEQRPVEQAVTGDEFESIKTWLSGLSTPIAIMVASDQFATILFEACHQLDLTIPENVSVVGVDNDRPFCDLCRPKLSSLQPDHEQVGYLAAQALSRLIDGDSAPERLIEVSSHALYERQSSDLIAIKDQATLQAMKYIRAHAAESPSLDEIAQASGTSRSVLQRRFRRYLKRTIGEVVLNEKLRIAREMLRDTKLPIV